MKICWLNVHVNSTFDVLLVSRRQQINPLFFHLFIENILSSHFWVCASRIMRHLGQWVGGLRLLPYYFFSIWPRCLSGFLPKSLCLKFSNKNCLIVLSWLLISISGLLKFIEIEPRNEVVFKIYFLCLEGRNWNKKYRENVNILPELIFSTLENMFLVLKSINNLYMVYQSGSSQESRDHTNYFKKENLI